MTHRSVLATTAVRGIDLPTKGTHMTIYLSALRIGLTPSLLGAPGGVIARRRLAAGFHEDRHAALTEDVVANGSAALAMALLA
jgi:uncharacterized membrane protein